MSVELLAGIIFGAAIGFAGAIGIMALARELAERWDDFPPRG